MKRVKCKNKRKKPDCKEQVWRGEVFEQEVDCTSNEELADTLARALGRNNDEVSRRIYETVLQGLSELYVESTGDQSNKVPRPK